MNVAALQRRVPADASRLIELPCAETTPLLTPALVTGAAHVITVADPFPVFHRNTLFVLAEIEGTRRDGTYFKKIGVFRIGNDLRKAEYLGETWPEADGEYSFPFVLKDGDRFLMVPDVGCPGAPAEKRLRIYQSDADRFPFGWTCLHDAPLPGAVSPSDKVLLHRDGRWYLFASDVFGGGRLLLYHSGDLQSWRLHPASPVLKRRTWDRLLNRFVSTRVYRFRPWRLGGGTVALNGHTILFVQHMGPKRVYGEAVTPLLIEQLDPSAVRIRLGSRPVLSASSAVPWRSVSAHHVAFARTNRFPVVATDGFDGEFWCSTVQRYDSPAETEFDSGPAGGA